jgi:hypothetical protein
VAVSVGALVGCVIGWVSFSVLERIQGGLRPRMMGAGVLFIWVLSFAVTALLARAIPFGVREKADPAWTANLVMQGNVVVAIAPATMAVTLFLLVRAERRFKRSQQKNEKIEVKVIPRERLWRAVFGGVFFLGLVALNATGPGFHLSPARAWDVCLLREPSSAPAIVAGYFVLLASLVPRRWLSLFKK